MTNASEPVACAEKDNVTINLASSEVRRFRIEAVHPAYAGALRDDRFAPDFTACPQELSRETTEVRPPKRVTFYEDVETWLTGYTFTNYWRPHDIPFRVGDRVERGLHVVQLWVRRDERAEEVLVIYPGDGYWRIRPLPPKHLGWSAYGSSFLIGPVEAEARPVVKISAIDFDPATLTFRLAFAAGGGATLKIDKLDRERLALDVAFDRRDRRPALRGAALDVRHRDQQRRRPRRVARGKRQGLARGAHHGLQGREGDRPVGRARRALAPQHQRAGPRVQPLPVRLIGAKA